MHEYSNTRKYTNTRAHMQYSIHATYTIHAHKDFSISTALTALSTTLLSTLLKLNGSLT